MAERHGQEASAAGSDAAVRSVSLELVAELQKRVGELLWLLHSREQFAVSDNLESVASMTRAVAQFRASAEAVAGHAEEYIKFE